MSDNCVAIRRNEKPYVEIFSINFFTLIGGDIVIEPRVNLVTGVDYEEEVNLKAFKIGVSEKIGDFPGFT